MTSRRWVVALVVAALGDVAFELVQLPSRGGAPLLAGPWVAPVAVLWDVLVLVAAVGVAVSFRRAWHELYHRNQVEAASGAMSSDWLWESDRDGRLTYCSPGVEELLGYAPAELVGQSTDVLCSDDRTRTDVRRALDARTGWAQREAHWRHKNGSLVRLLGSAVAIRDRRGRVVGYRGTRRLASGSAQTGSDLSAAAARLDAVLAGDEVDVALQPIVSLASGAVAGVEALARFHDGRPPDTWFREAALLGRERDLDEHLFTKAVGLLDTLPAAVHLSVNAGPELLMDAGFRRRLLSSGAPLERLLVEITEHAQVRDYDALRAAVSGLREHGVRFAIDDTGAGYASFSHVLQLRPDVIKLDRGLLAELEEDPARRSLVTALVLLALDIGATLTGEGVETAAQLEALATLGVDQAQGYQLARPTTDRGLWTSWWESRWLPEQRRGGTPQPGPTAPTSPRADPVR
jgi:PAS domain S-box-containing protein